MKVLLTLTSDAEFQLWFQAMLLREQVLTTTEMEKHGVEGEKHGVIMFGVLDGFIPECFQLMLAQPPPQ